MRDVVKSALYFGAAAILTSSLLTSTARANVYPTNLKINGSTNNAVIAVGQTVQLSYILNEPASGGAIVKVLSGTTPIRSIAIISGNPGTLRGVNTVAWDGKADGGSTAPAGTYGFSVTASSTGYTNWTKTTYDTNIYNQAVLPWGIAVNQNTNSFYYGRVFVANTYPGSNPDTVPGDRVGFQKLNADGSPGDEGVFSDGGYSWAANFSPFRVRVGEDDRFYAEDWQGSGVVMAWDQEITSNSIAYVMRDDNNPGGSFSGFYVSGTGATRKMWMVDSSQGASGVGVRVWNVLTNGVVATNDLGTTAIPASLSVTNGLDDSAFDIGLDGTGKIYLACIPSFNSEYKVMRFPAYAGAPLTNADWRADNTSSAGDKFAISVNAAATMVAVAQVSGSVALLDATSGTTITNIDDNGNPHRAVAWDKVGNLYLTYDGSIGPSVWQAWSPPGANSSTTVGLESILVTTPLVITSIVPSGGNFVIGFSGSPSDPASAFTLLSGSTVTTVTNTTAATITGSNGTYQAVVAANGPMQFYRIKR